MFFLDTTRTQMSHYASHECSLHLSHSICLHRLAWGHCYLRYLAEAERLLLNDFLFCQAAFFFLILWVYSLGFYWHFCSLVYIHGYFQTAVFISSKSQIYELKSKTRNLPLCHYLTLQIPSYSPSFGVVLFLFYL